ncbi:TetR/AcrR family transcriptional regulator [Bailinhaonella thermotolerans]|uniref:TetR/AcrR family transcriptional regulator n=1 Tax=Bailinhaonella thermotolerans TaxID=1070861 RepID=A0A3A4B2I2_9ACTN|nr:TetR/AcrR family transcriptional regulator [Bailinhaonella thermotolerans]RJL35935.1 TetR/AcrR family transcriptional regulator [Bailinhaonella thermotolerans]
MARPRKFDEAQAIEAAMRAFWALGYEATTTQDLCEATGLNPSSVYNTFRSKRDLFLLALRRYLDDLAGRQIALMESAAPIREKVGGLLDQIIADETGDRLGCLAVNTAIELAPRDAEVAGLLARDYDRRITAMRGAFESARLDGELSGDRDPLALAHFVNAGVAGIRVVSRSGADRTALRAISATVLAAL